MKRFPQIDRFFTAVCSFSILALFVLLSSCEKDSLQDDSLRIKASNVSAASIVAKVYDNSIDCHVDCIVAGSGEYYVKSDTETGGNNSNSKEVSYKAYNTETQFIVEVTYLITSGNSNAKATITVDVDFDNDQFDKTKVEDELPSSLTPVIFAFDLPSDWKSCDIVDFNVYQEALGNPIKFEESYSLIGVCSSTCNESFSYEENQDDSYTFHYISSEDLEGAEVKFTCPHITDFVILDGKEYEVNPGNSKGSPTVLTWTGDIQACTEITFILAFDADCDQANSGKANLFTDFKVDGESKKGDNENIVYNCN